MQGWQTTYLGLKELPREISGFELQYFFTFGRPEREVIDGRRGAIHRLGLALHIGFLRMTGRTLDAVRIVPKALWGHLGKELGVVGPELASLKALYGRRSTLYEHQQLAQQTLGVSRMTDHQTRSLVGALRAETARLGDKAQLLVFAKRWLYEHKFLIDHDRVLRRQVAAALNLLEAQTSAAITASASPTVLAQWIRALATLRPDGQTQQAWLWQAPAKHSTVQLAQVFERIELLYELQVPQHLADISDVVVRRYARQLANRPPSVGARIKEPRRTLEVACFLRYCLLSATDQVILMIQRRVADLWRQAREEVPEVVSWAVLYKNLLADLTALTEKDQLTESEFKASIVALLATRAQDKPPSRASLVRERLFDSIRPVRALLAQIGKLPWQAEADNPVLAALRRLLELYAAKAVELPADVSAAKLGRVWSAAITGTDRNKAMRALEVATLLGLRRAVRNGSVWVEHSQVFRGRARLFFTPERWETESKRHYARLDLPSKASVFLKPLLGRVQAGVTAVAQAARDGVLSVDDELHLNAMPAEDEDPKVIELRAQLDQRLGEVQLPEVILQVDAQVRFSWIMLGREPRSTDELLMVYAGILAHGTSLSSAECARMIPQLSAVSIRQAMRWAGDERRLSQACNAVLAFMQRHPIAATWGRSDLASSDMMSMETTKRVWQARLDPRRATPSVGIYSHVRDRWGISYAQPFVLNERQAGVAIEGVLRQERMDTRRLDISQLAVDTHGYTDFAMMLARLVGFDLCPRLKELRQRHLCLPRGMTVPAEIANVCETTVDIALIEQHWDTLVNLAASVMTGNASAVAALARFGSAARGEPVYEAGVQLGRLLRTAFLADYFVKAPFRQELRRVLNRGEAVNAMKRAIYTGKITPAQARRGDEMQAVADGLSLLANTVMAWNTMQMQAIITRWANRRQIIEADIMARIAPTRLSGINLRGVFRFPLERYVADLMPSLATPIHAAAA